jgi:hypothetical protein
MSERASFIAEAEERLREAREPLMMAAKLLDTAAAGSAHTFTLKSVTLLDNASTCAAQKREELNNRTEV